MITSHQNSKMKATNWMQNAFFFSEVASCKPLEVNSHFNLLHLIPSLFDPTNLIMFQMRQLLFVLLSFFLWDSCSVSAFYQHPTPPRTSALFSRRTPEDLYAAVHRKEYEMKAVKAQHTGISDPVRMALEYSLESIPNMRLAKALRRVYDDPESPANPNAKPRSVEDQKRQDKLLDVGMADLGMRRASFIVDIKRKSLSRPGEVFCNYDDAGMVAEAMVRLGADAVFVNTDYHAYGGDMTELKSAVRAVRRISKTVPVVMKDIVVDEIQLGLAKEAGADGIILIASVLGPALNNFLDLATTIGLETIVECHTRNEVQRALDALACNILVSNYDRVSQTYYPQQAVQLAGMFPGSGGPIICLAGGGIEDTDQMKRHLAVGYDGVVVGKAVMGNPSAPEFIRAVRDRTLLPAELSQWGLEDVEFDMDGQPMPGTKKEGTSRGGIPTASDKDVFQ
jgi:indole-3-glycerol phosphate synthase